MAHMPGLPCRTGEAVADQARGCTSPSVFLRPATQKALSYHLIPLHAVSMAARKRRTTLDDAWREKIQTSMLVNRLHSNALGKLKKEMSQGQIKSAEILLRKTAPDLSATDHTGEIAMPVTPVDRGPRETREQWLERKQREFLRVVTPAGAAE